MYTGDVSSLAEQIANQLQAKDDPVPLLEKRDLVRFMGVVVLANITETLLHILPWYMTFLYLWSRWFSTLIIGSTATLLEPYRNDTYKNKDYLRFHKGKKLFQVYKSMFSYCNSFCSKKKDLWEVHYIIAELLLLSHVVVKLFNCYHL